MRKVKPLITVVRAGHINYNIGLQLQKFLSDQPKSPSENFKNYIILQEYDPVYTIGIRTKGYTNKDEERLRKLGAEFYRTDRGGLITFHGPGQLVAYPILHLQQYTSSLRWYVKSLELAVIETCCRLGIPEATTTKDTGIWVGDNKICAVGVHCSRYVTTHGIGLNCCTDLKWFDHIVPCGIEGKGVTSLSQQLNRHVSIEEAMNSFLLSFKSVFNCRIQEEQIDTNSLITEAKKLKF